MPEPIAPRLLAWFDQHGRHDLPWQHPRSAYRVWVAEVMLQQTQVVTVIPYFKRFIKRFPEVSSLAGADQDAVLQCWAGLGYYSRARNLHKAAGKIEQDHAGVFPKDLAQAQALPGIGPSTAAAILAQAFGQRHAILDGNVKRVLSRYHAVDGWAGEAPIQRKLWSLAERHTPHERLADYTQAIMDLGATVCKRQQPKCADCPIMKGCQAHLLGRIHELPTRRPRRARPVRRSRMLVVENAAGEILLLQRPPSGIWGGLWSLPELPEDMEAVSYCAEQLALSVTPPREAPAIRHGFTHFELTIQPLLVSVVGSRDQICERGNWQWYKPGEANTEPALPAPLSRLLRGKMLHSVADETAS